VSVAAALPGPMSACCSRPDVFVRLDACAQLTADGSTEQLLLWEPRQGSSRETGLPTYDVQRSEQFAENLCTGHCNVHAWSLFVPEPQSVRHSVILRPFSRCEYALLVVLRHKLRRERAEVLAAQHGHRDRMPTSWTIRRRRRVAMEFGTWRSGRSGGASGSITFGKGKFREENFGN
jgi:hypothetical protein